MVTRLLEHEVRLREAYKARHVVLLDGEEFDEHRRRLSEQRQEGKRARGVGVSESEEGTRWCHGGMWRRWPHLVDLRAPLVCHEGVTAEHLTPWRGGQLAEEPVGGTHGVGGLGVSVDVELVPVGFILCVGGGRWQSWR